MRKPVRFGFWLILGFSIYHLVRDILQILGFQAVWVNIFHWPHLWCKPYCDYVTFPLDFWGIIGSGMVIKRDRVGILGTGIILSMSLWLLAVLLS